VTTATTAKDPGLSYTRYSAGKQGAGDSQDRQDEAFHSFCRNHRLTPLAESFADRGRSGYHDEHRKKGRLGDLIAAAKVPGRFPPRTVVVVEAWDRLGRLRPDRQIKLIEELLQTGLRIGICRINDVFEEADFGTDKWISLCFFVKLAYEESRQKAERVAKDWARRRERAQAKGSFVPSKKGKVGHLPAWLRAVNGEVVQVPERVAALKRLFELSRDGLGEARIARLFNDPKDGEAPFGKAKWGRCYVRKLLRDRRVLGELQLHKKDADGKLVEDGRPIPQYYPRAVDDDLFNLAQDAQNKTGRKRYRDRTKDRKHVNAFAGLLVHARDGEGFEMVNPRTAAKPHFLLVASAGRNGKGGTSYTFPYRVFEEAILSCLREVDPRDVLPRADGGASRVEVLKAKLANVREQVRQLQEELREGFSKGLAAVLREQEAQEGTLTGELQEELARAARPVEQAWREVHSLAAVVKEGGDEVRLKLRPVLRRAVERMVVLTVPLRYRRLCVVQVRFEGGGQREYVIDYSPANKSSRGWYRVASMRSPFGNYDPESPAYTGLVPFDLGDPAGLDRVENEVMAVDDDTLEQYFAGCPKQPLP
jgi:DNA invertase Pin-like site-specific DNA recombinase